MMPNSVLDLLNGMEALDQTKGKIHPRSDKSVPRDLSARQALDGDWLQGVEPSGGVKSHENLSELDPGLLNIRCQHTT